MHKDLKTALTATVYLASAAVYQHYGVMPRFFPMAFAREDGARPDAPILRSETLNRAHNRRRHMDRLYDKMDDDLYDTTLSPLFLDDALPAQKPSTTRLQLGSTSDIMQQAFGGRAALTSLADKIDFDSAAGTFPTQSRTIRAPISIWVAGNITDIENHITGSGYDPGLSGDTVSIDSGVDYLLDDGLVVGIGVGWGSTLGESSARQLRYRESNLSVSPYFVARMTDWLNLRGSFSFGKSTITQSAIGTIPDNLRYAETLGSNTISNTIGFGSKYEFGSLPVSVELYGDMITAREYVQNARANDGTIVFGNTATTRLFDTGAEGRYRMLMGDHAIIPFIGQEETISLMNQNYGRSGSTRYYAGSQYAYEPLNFDMRVQGFREMATNTSLVEGIRSEFAFTHEFPRGYATLHPFINVESTNLYFDTGGGMTYDWGRIPGQINFEVRRKFTYEIHHRDYTGLVSVDFPF